MIQVRNARIITMDKKDYLDGADILIDDNGKIKSIGIDIPHQKNALQVNAHGLYAVPGLIDAHSHLGMWEDAVGFEGADGNEMTDPITPHMRAIDGINPMDRCFSEAAAGGVTMVATGPGSANIIGGTFACVRTHGRTIDEVLVHEPTALKIAFGENPKSVYGKHEKAPQTRMAVAAMLREALVEAQEYKMRRDAAKGDVDKMPERDLKKEVLVEALERRLQVKAHAHRADDIMTAIRIANEFNLRMTIEHASEAHLIPDVIAKSKIPLCLGPIFTERSKVELKNLSFEAPRILHEAGVTFAFITDHPVIPQQYAALQAAMAVREGLPEEVGLQALTVNPAKILGIDAIAGKIARGRMANIALFDRPPMDMRARCRITIVNGELVYGDPV